MRIAIIGSGISGLTATYRLFREHQVTLFEANDYLGGHTHTVDVEIGGEHHAIDTGFIVFNERTYPHFTAFLSELNVATRPTSMSFSVRSERSGLEYNGSSINGLFAQRRNLLRLRFYLMLRDILRFNRNALTHFSPDAPNKPRENVTVREFLAQGRFTREFAEHYLLPMGSAIWSCPTDRFAEFPIRFVIEFYRNHGLLSLSDRPTWKVVEGGSRSYVDALQQRFRRGVDVRLRIPVQVVRRHPDRVDVTPRNGETESFDHVVFACHSDQALRMLADPSRTEREVLSAFPYERNVALLHTDSAILPQRRRAWASWNYFVSHEADSRATVTYCMNILQHLQSRHVFNVTLNGEKYIDPAKVLGRFVYEHPVFTTRREAAQSRHAELINVNRSSFCGAYWRNGFHEDGVVSALAVCRSLETASRASSESPRNHSRLQPVVLES